SNVYAPALVVMTRILGKEDYRRRIERQRPDLQGLYCPLRVLGSAIVPNGRRPFSVSCFLIQTQICNQRRRDLKGVAGTCINTRCNLLPVQENVIDQNGVVVSKAECRPIRCTGLVYSIR